MLRLLNEPSMNNDNDNDAARLHDRLTVFVLLQKYLIYLDIFYYSSFSEDFLSTSFES